MQRIRVGARLSAPTAPSVAAATAAATAVAGVAEALDELGVDVFILDRRVGASAGRVTIDPDVLLGYLARRTARIGLAVGESLGEGRMASVLAKSVTSLDLCSEGRALVMVRPAAVADRFERAARFTEGCSILRSVLDGNGAPWRGRYESLDGAWNEPRVTGRARVPVIVDIGNGDDGAGAAPAGSADYVVVAPPSGGDLDQFVRRSGGAGGGTALPVLASLDPRVHSDLRGAATRCLAAGFTGVVIELVSADAVPQSTSAADFAALVALFAVD